MKDKYIANILIGERRRRRLSAEVIRSGLCDQSTYSRLESGENIGSIQLVIMLLQRLGVNGNRAGRYLCRDEYDEMQARLWILECIKAGKLADADTYIEKYMKEYCAESHLNSQFADYMRARMSELSGDNERALELYKKAAAYTIDDYRECPAFVCMSLCEYFIVANIARLTAILEDRTEAMELYGKLLVYCRSGGIEKWNVTCMYAKTICEMLQIYPPEEMGMRERHRWFEECDAAVKILRETSRLHFIAALLKNRQKLAALMGYDADRRLDDFLACYEWLRKRFGMEGDLFEWYPYYIDCAFYPVEKLIDERRKISGMSKEKLAEGICSTETVSRIINRKVSPKYGTVAALLDKLGLRGALHEYVIVSDDMTAHRLWDEIVRCNVIGDYGTEKKMYYKLSDRLDGSCSINKTVLQYSREEIDKDGQNIDYGQMAVQCQQMLGISVKDIRHLTIFTRIESMVINRMFYCYDRVKNYSELGTYEQLCNIYYSNGVGRCFANDYEGILVRCANYIGNKGDFESANIYSERGIMLELETERMHTLSTLLYCISWNNVESGKGVTSSDIEMCKCAYHVADFLREEARKQIYERWLVRNNIIEK